MPSVDEWTVVFYVSESGQEPIKRFIRSLDEPTQAKLTALIERLRQNEGELQYPQVRPMGGQLMELRLTSNKRLYRAIYFTHTGKKIVILHAFQKHGQRTEQHELETARRRYSEYTNG